MASTAKKSQGVPALAKQQAKIAMLAQENQRLKIENAQLKQELEQYLDQWETIDGPALNLVVHLAAVESGTAAAIAKATRANIQIVETSLNYLLKLRYVQTEGRGRTRVYSLLPKSVRYLRERGLHK